MKKSAEFINEEEDDDESSMDVADTVEVSTTPMESKLEQVYVWSRDFEFAKKISLYWISF